MIDKEQLRTFFAHERLRRKPRGPHGEDEPMEATLLSTAGNLTLLAMTLVGAGAFGFWHGAVSAMVWMFVVLNLIVLVAQCLARLARVIGRLGTRPAQQDER